MAAPGTAESSTGAVLLVCGLPKESGRIRVQRREKSPSSLRDAYGIPELLFAAPPPPSSIAGLTTALPQLCMPDGVTFMDAPPPPPRYFTTTLPGAGNASTHLACCLFYEELPSNRLMPLLTKAINSHSASDMDVVEDGANAGQSSRARARSEATGTRRPSSSAHSKCAHTQANSNAAAPEDGPAGASSDAGSSAARSAHPSRARTSGSRRW